MTTAAINAPLPFTKEAIVGHLQHHATNGPAYVQIQATKALARMLGLFDHAKQTVQQTVSHAEAAAQMKRSAIYSKIAAIRSGEYIVTDEDLGDFLIPDSTASDSPDDEASTPDDDEIP